MPTLYNPPISYVDQITKWECVPISGGTIVLRDDVICFGIMPKPYNVASVTPNNFGYIVKSYHNNTMNWILARTETNHLGSDHTILVSLWRRKGQKLLHNPFEKQKRPYRPSFWATPVPLP